MNSTLLPGVKWKEYDFSNYAKTLGAMIFGVVGTASKGDFDKRILITNPDQMKRDLGYRNASYPALDAVNSYLDEGSYVLFVRVGSSSTPAAQSSVSVASVTGAAVTWKAKNKGTFYDGVRIDISHGGARLTSVSKLGSQGVAGVFTIQLSPNVIPKTLTVKLNSSVSLTDTAGSGTLTGTGVSGTINYATGALSVTYTVAPSNPDVILASGQYYSTFSVSLSKTVAGKEYKFEEYVGLTLAAAGTSDSSWLTQMAGSNLLSVNATDLPLVVFPAPGSYSLANGNDGLTGISDADYIGVSTGVTRTGLQLFASPSLVDVNAVAVPGVSSVAVTQALLTVAATRRDAMIFLDPPSGLTPQEVMDWADGVNSYNTRPSINETHATICYPWYYEYDPDSAVERLVPPTSSAMSAAMARARQVSIADAPAGPLHGKVLRATRVQTEMDEATAGLLYANRINPIIDMVGQGIVIMGQKTSQTTASSTDRIGARVLLDVIEKQIVTGLFPLLFKRINQSTYNAAIAIGQPLLDGYVAKEELVQGLFVCNEDINPISSRQNNQLNCNVLLELPKYGEVIAVNFVLMPTGAKVEEYRGKVF